MSTTTVGEILDSFFSPWSTEKLWIMDEKDGYTALVRKWQPVANQLSKIKLDLMTNCGVWQATHMTTPTWKPTISSQVSPDPNAYRSWVTSPPGTDPKTCKKAFVIYVTTKVASKLKYVIPGAPPVPEIQTWQLQTCSIGSFSLYVTVDTIDCTARTATMKVWMYNPMSKQSFGRFADDPAFAASGMKTQYMWWWWTETYQW